MKNAEREEIRNDYIENVYKKSWTFERLTPTEQTKIIDLLYNAKLFANKKFDVAKELHIIYTAFLEALNYEPLNWRK